MILSYPFLNVKLFVTIIENRPCGMYQIKYEDPEL